MRHNARRRAANDRQRWHHKIRRHQRIRQHNGHIFDLTPFHEQRIFANKTIGANGGRSARYIRLYARVRAFEPPKRSMPPSQRSKEAMKKIVSVNAICASFFSSASRRTYGERVKRNARFELLCTRPQRAVAANVSEFSNGQIAQVAS